MKKIILLMIGTLMLGTISYAQDDTIDSFFLKKSDSSVKKARLNIAVPDAPAFKALGTDPSEILRPSDAKQFALIIPNFLSGSKVVVPSSFAAEVSPGLLLSNYSLNDYYNKPALRALVKTRFSIGSAADESIGRKVALGIRTTLFESKEFKADRAFINENIRNRFLKPIHKRVDSAFEAYVALHPEVLENQELAKQKKAEIKKSLVESGVIVDLPQVIDSLKNVYKKKYWNATRLDVAYSYVAQTKDSLVKNLVTDRHIFWLAGSIRPGCNWAQLLFSVNTKLYSIEGAHKSDWVINHRTYIGANTIKGFLEAQYKKEFLDAKTEEKSLLLNLGLEVSVLDGVWLHLGTGVQNYLDKSTRKTELTGNLNIFVTFPENFKLF